MACVNGYKEVAKLLIANKAKLNAQDDEGLTPLHVAAKFNQVRAYNAWHILWNCQCIVSLIIYGSLD